MLNPPESIKQGTVGVPGRLSLCCRGCPVHYGIFNSTLNLSRLVPNNILPSCEKQECLDVTQCPGGRGYGNRGCAKGPLFENHCHKEIPPLPWFCRKACLSQSAFCFSTLDNISWNILCFISHYSIIGKNKKALCKCRHTWLPAPGLSVRSLWEQQLGLGES